MRYGQKVWQWRFESCNSDCIEKLWGAIWAKNYESDDLTVKNFDGNNATGNYEEIDDVFDANNLFVKIVTVLAVKFLL